MLLQEFIVLSLVLSIHPRRECRGKQRRRWSDIDCMFIRRLCFRSSASFFLSAALHQVDQRTTNAFFVEFIVFGTRYTILRFQGTY